MAGKPFSASIEPGGDDSILRLSGDINRAAAEGLAAAFRGACATGATRIGFDFTDVGFLNSSGIALIVGILREARTSEIEVVAWGLSDHYREIFEITRIVEFMSVHDDQNTAFAAG